MQHWLVERDGMNSTLRAGLEVLEALRAMQSALGVTELARGLGRDKANVHRVLATLAAHGFVHQDVSSRKYRLGRAWALPPDAATRSPSARCGSRADVAAAWLTTPAQVGGEASLAPLSSGQS